MKRPQSAKPGHKGNWGQYSVEDANQQSNIQRHQNRKQVKLMRPDLTTHDFARILPRKIQQDKERLYSEALQLKQSMNELAEENIRLKTKISILEREKDKMNKFMDTAPESIGNKGSRINIYQSKSYEKENMIIRNLKKIVKQSREENELLKNDSLKIKKTMKYTKINEFQIERKIIIDENKRLNALLEDYSSQFENQEQIQRENEELKGYLEQQLEEKQQMAEDKEKYEEIIESLEEKLKSQEQKYQNKEKKMLRDLNSEKRRVQQFQRKNDELAREVKSLKQAHQHYVNIKANSGPVKPLNRATQNNVRIGNSKVNTQQSQGQHQLQKKLSEVNHYNQKLEKQLSEVKAKLNKAEDEICTLQQREKVVNRSNLNISQLEKNQQYQAFAKRQESQQVKIQNSKHADEEEDYDYDDQFDNEVKMKENKEEQQIQSLKKQFQQNDEEEQLYKKEEVKKSKHSQKEKTKDKKANSKESYKPNKKILAEIKELLTYRMKSQRYPFDDIKTDINSAETETFSYQDLCNMFVNEPFYLTTEYTQAFLSYCFEKVKVSPSDSLTKEVLVSKLRKVVDDFTLLEEDEEKEMIVRIAEMTSTYPRELQVAFENIKNGEETVGRKDLIQMFKQLELQDQYIELIIAELSLCSDDLEHLNFHGFFQRFYIEEENEDYVDNAIQEQESEESYKNSSRIKKKSTKAKQHGSEDEHQQII